eukprot:8452861-Pyramimonas_sp.AAC.1
MLARMVDGGARNMAQRLRLTAFQDPVDFLYYLASHTAQGKKKGDVVLAPTADTDYCIAAQIVAALTGATTWL